LSTYRNKGQKKLQATFNYANKDLRSFESIKELENFYFNEFKKDLKILANYNRDTAKTSLLYDAFYLRNSAVRSRMLNNDDFLKMIEQDKEVQKLIESIKKIDITTQDSAYLHRLKNVDPSLLEFSKHLSKNLLSLIEKSLKITKVSDSNRELNSKVIGTVEGINHLINAEISSNEMKVNLLKDYLAPLEKGYKAGLELKEEAKEMMLKPLPMVFEIKKKPEFILKVEGSKEYFLDDVDLQTAISQIHVLSNKYKDKLEKWLRAEKLDIPVVVNSAGKRTVVANTADAELTSGSYMFLSLQQSLKKVKEKAKNIFVKG
jgi:hypothetical protein